MHFFDIISAARRDAQATRVRANATCSAACNARISDLQYYSLHCPDRRSFVLNVRLTVSPSLIFNLSISDCVISIPVFFSEWQLICKSPAFTAPLNMLTVLALHAAL